MPGEGQAGFVASSDPAEAQQQIEQWKQGFADKAQRYQAVARETEEIRLTAASEDGRVRVTVRADGGVVDLQLTDKVRNMPPAELSAKILEIMGKAQSQIADRIGGVLTEHLGDEDVQTRSMVLDNLRERFPEQSEQEPESADPGSGKWEFPGEGEVAERPEGEREPRRPDTPEQSSAQPAAPEQADPPPSPKPRRRRGDDGLEDFGDDFDPLRD